MKDRVLIIDDEMCICDALTFALSTSYEVLSYCNPEDGVEYLRSNNVDAILLDQRLGEYDGLDILRQIRDADLRVAVIMMTAYGSKETQTLAMELGAYAYLTKPLNTDQLRMMVAKAVDYVKAVDDIQYLFQELHDKKTDTKMIGHSPEITRIFKLINKVKDIDSTVLITGESGTGKEVAARLIHESGMRSSNRFVVLNCAAIPESLLETELFGYKKGAFTGAVGDQKGKFLIADKGTIFLDEIGDMPLHLQAKILRVLQEKIIVPVGDHQEIPVDVRVIAATNRDLKELVQQGKFREDLFYRLNVIRINMPPLRNRGSDILLLSNFFIDKFNKELKKNVRGMTEGAKKLVMGYYFPGNVRQLANLIERAMILTTGDMISPLVLQGIEPNESSPFAQSEALHPQRELTDGERLRILLKGKSLKEIERTAILATLEECDGVKSQAAKVLGISERSLWYKIKEYNIGRPEP